MHDAIDICLALALVLIAGAEIANLQPLAFLGGFLAAFHLTFHVGIGSLIVYRRMQRDNH